MFQKGDYVICGNNGICCVQDVTTLNISGVDKTREYYLLKPVFQSTSTVYVPLDTANKSIRKAASRKEADELIQSIPDIPLIPLADEKTLERTYKEYMHEGSCVAWIKLIKTIYLRFRDTYLNRVICQSESICNKGQYNVECGDHSRLRKKKRMRVGGFK